jgi:hypothetical protein
MKNQGFDASEIDLLRKECEAEGSSFVYFEDEDDMVDTGEMAHIQFIGKHEGKEVIYDAVIYTLRLHHSGMVYEEALKQIQKEYPKYVPMEERDSSYKANAQTDEEIEALITELMDAIEEEEEVKVSEHVEIDLDFDFGIGLDVALNVDAITDEVVEQFIKDFNNNTITLDKTLYSFMTDEEDED